MTDRPSDKAMEQVQRFIDARLRLDNALLASRAHCEEACEPGFDGSPGQPPCWYRKHDEPEVSEDAMCAACIGRQRARKALPNARRRERRAFARLAGPTNPKPLSERERTGEMK